VLPWHECGRLTFREVLVHDEEALLVDLEVLVVLEVVDLHLSKGFRNRVSSAPCPSLRCHTHHATSLLDEDGVLVETAGTTLILVHLSDLQDVL
jgi:hypothetical protein